MYTFGEHEEGACLPGQYREYRTNICKSCGAGKVPNPRYPNNSNTPCISGSANTTTSTSTTGSSAGTGTGTAAGRLTNIQTGANVTSLPPGYVPDALRPGANTGFVGGKLQGTGPKPGTGTSYTPPSTTEPTDTYVPPPADEAWYSKYKWFLVGGSALLVIGTITIILATRKPTLTPATIASLEGDMEDW